MKRCSNITGWTDYPIIALGDLPGKKAPIRRVKVLWYDGNKYITIKTPEGCIDQIKCGYLYRKPGRCGRVPNVSVRKLERGIWKTTDR